MFSATDHGGLNDINMSYSLKQDLTLRINILTTIFQNTNYIL